MVKGLNKEDDLRDNGGEFAEKKEEKDVKRGWKSHE